MTSYAKALLVCIALGLAVAVMMLIWGDHDSNEAVEPDLRGIYTYPGVGKYFVSQVNSPLTLAIFFSAETSCPSCLSEVASYKRLDSVFCERGQRVMAVISSEDYVAISAFLHKNRLNIPLFVAKLGLSFQEIGMYPKFMPFKILFDSTNTAIYMSGANNTPESQADFESAMLWLSDIVYEKVKDSLSWKRY